MRTLSFFVLRALCALFVGFLLVCNPTEMSALLVQIIGGMFVLSGIVVFIGYFVGRYRARRTREQLAAMGQLSTTPLYIPSPSSINLFVGIGAAALGIVLLLSPTTFIQILMYVLGGLLILVGLAQGLTFFNTRQLVPFSFALLLLPLLEIGAGLFTILKPQLANQIAFTILGIAYLCYGVTEFVFGIQLHNAQKRLEDQVRYMEEQIPEAVVVEEMEESEETEEQVPPSSIENV